MTSSRFTTIHMTAGPGLNHHQMRMMIAEKKNVGGNDEEKKRKRNEAKVVAVTKEKSQIRNGAKEKETTTHHHHQIQKMIQASHQKKRNVAVKSDVIRKNTTGIGIEIGKDVIEMTVIERDRGEYQSLNPSF